MPLYMIADLTPRQVLRVVNRLVIKGVVESEEPESVLSKISHFLNTYNLNRSGGFQLTLSLDTDVAEGMND